MIFAVVPAAGQSTRMGRPKLAMPWRGRTVLEHVVSTLQQGGADHIVVVLAPDANKLEPLAAKAGALVLVLEYPTLDMRQTVEHGLLWLENQYSPKPEDAWLLQPADHPGIESAVVQAVCSGYLGQRSNEPSILVPVFQGRRGHPALIAWRHVPGIRSHPAGQGLDSYLRLHARETLELAVESGAILDDLDTPEDYERLQ
jgi:CTP:molybdopterin cytidylyltransferase MocA